MKTVKKTRKTDIKPYIKNDQARVNRVMKTIESVVRGADSASNKKMDKLKPNDDEASDEKKKKTTTHYGEVAVIMEYDEFC